MPPFSTLFETTGRLIFFISSDRDCESLAPVFQPLSDGFLNTKVIERELLTQQTAVAWGYGAAPAPGAVFVGLDCECFGGAEVDRRL